MKVSDDRSLKESISKCLPRERFRFALVHSQPFIRIAAFRAMRCVLTSYKNSLDLEEEAAMWKFALPYSIRTTESKEYLSNLLQCLCHFLDRVSIYEATDTIDPGCDILPIFNAFVINFLVDDVVLNKAAYSGTIADKEIFGVSLLECLLAFALQDESYSGGTITKKNAIFNRKRSMKEETAMGLIIKALLKQDVLSALFGLLHSIWDGTREKSFQCLMKMMVASQLTRIVLAVEYCEKNQRKYILARGIFLASSPRQRESDTGARMLCFLYASSPGNAEKDSYIATLVSISMERVSSMKNTLNGIMSDRSLSVEKNDGSRLPLAHGLIHAIRLCIDHDKTEQRLRSTRNKKVNITLNESMVEVCCKALQLSLSVVADVREGEHIDGIDEEVFLTVNENASESTPLNVNTGAVGANGTFSSVTTTNKEESNERHAIQRVIVRQYVFCLNDLNPFLLIISSSLLSDYYFLGWKLVINEGNVRCNRLCYNN